MAQEAVLTIFGAEFNAMKQLRDTGYTNLIIAENPTQTMLDITAIPPPATLPTPRPGRNGNISQPRMLSLAPIITRPEQEDLFYFKNNPRIDCWPYHSIERSQDLISQQTPRINRAQTV